MARGDAPTACMQARGSTPGGPLYARGSTTGHKCEGHYILERFGTACYSIHYTDRLRLQTPMESLELLRVASEVLITVSTWRSPSPDAVDISPERQTGFAASRYR